MLLLPIFIHGTLNNIVIYFEASPNGDESISEYMAMIQNIIGTAMATFLGAYLAFRWQNKCEAETEERKILR